MTVKHYDALRKATNGFSGRLDQVTKEQWKKQSCCDEWSVGELVDHVIGGQSFTAEILRGARSDAALETAIGVAIAGMQNRVEAYSAATLEMFEAIDSPRKTGDVYHHLVGDISQSAVMGLRIFDLTLHIWDLSRSIGADEQLDPELVQIVWDNSSLFSGAITQGGALGQGPSGSVSDDAPLQTRLLDLTGRR